MLALSRLSDRVLGLETHGADRIANLMRHSSGDAPERRQAIGVGQTSGDLYIAIGHYQRQGTAIPPGLNIFTPKFTLETTSGGTSVQLPLKFTLDFNNDGTLNVAASTVSVGGVP